VPEDHARRLLEARSAAADAQRHAPRPKDVLDGRTPAKPVALQQGQVLLTRLIRQANDVSLPGAAVVMSEMIGQAVFKFTDDLRLEIEVGSGEFALAEWPEFSKRYGYLMNWNLAKVRRGALAVADARVEYFNEEGQPYFYAIALYEHNEFKFLAEGMKQVTEGEFERVMGEEESGGSLMEGMIWIVTTMPKRLHRRALSLPLLV